MAFIAIVGAGDLGGSVAQAVAEREIAAEIRLIDPAVNVAAGKALDIAQAGAAGGSRCRLAGTADPRAAAGAAAIVLADWAAASGQPSHEPQGEEGLALLRRLWTMVAADTVPIVCAGASHGPLITLAVRELGIDRRRLIGSAPAALEAAARAMVALALDGSGRQVSLMVLGSPPALVVPCWSQATVGGALVTSRLTAAEIARLDGMMPHLWPPGPVALGAAAASAVRSIVLDAREELTCLIVLDGEMGMRRTSTALPVRLGARGIERIREPELTPREATRLRGMAG